MAELKPKTPDKHIGIEIEMICKLNREKLTTLVRSLKMQDLIDVGTDGSIEDYPANYHGHELRVLTTRKKLYGDMKRIKAMFKSIDAYANVSCGLHVHLDCRNTDPKKVFARLIKRQTEMFLMVEPTRRQNEYCLPLVEMNMDDFEDDFESSGSHYHGINVAAYDDHKTIEIRMHEGTTDCDEIYDWCKYLFNTAYGVLRNEETKSYIKARKSKFSPIYSESILSFNFDIEKSNKRSKERKSEDPWANYR